MSKKIHELTAQEIVKLAEEKAKQFHDDKLKTNQIRNFYASITRLRTDYDLNEDFSAIEQELVMLQPKLAYAAGRQQAVRKNFYPFMRQAIEDVIEAPNRHQALRKFFALVESVVAYHKYYGDN